MPTCAVLSLSCCRWCGPCRSLTPLLEGVASEQHGEVELAKVDIDALPDLALQYGVSATAQWGIATSVWYSYLSVV